jgi:arginine/lysine/ornithine decarboxylase
VPCPPAVPVAVSGEIIDRQCIEIFRAYGIKTVLVMKN